MIFSWGFSLCFLTLLLTNTSSNACWGVACSIGTLCCKKDTIPSYVTLFSGTSTDQKQNQVNNVMFCEAVKCPVISKLQQKEMWFVYVISIFHFNFYFRVITDTDGACKQQRDQPYTYASPSPHFLHRWRQQHWSSLLFSAVGLISHSS